MSSTADRMCVPVSLYGMTVNSIYNIVNRCSTRNEPNQKARSHIFRLRVWVQHPFFDERYSETETDTERDNETD